ncbi:OprD family porin [Pseudomonas sp. Marseille-Q8238]
MNKLPSAAPWARMTLLALAVHLPTLALASQQADSKGFIEDGSATLLVRNYYWNAQNQGDGHHADARNNRDARNWTQGFLLNYTSGFTQGTVGFGIDVNGYLGLKLDGGDGHTGTPTLPVNGDGHSPSDFSKLGGAVKLRISNTVLKYGSMQQPTAPVFAAGGNYLLPQTATGFSLTSQEIEGLDIEAGHFTAGTGSVTTSGDGGIYAAYAGQETRAADYLGGRYTVNDQLSVALYNGRFKDLWNQYYGNLNFVQPLADGQSLSLDANLYRTTDSGSAKAGGIDTTAWSLAAGYTLGAHTLTLIHQSIHGDQPFDYVGLGKPSAGYYADSIYLGNSSQYSDFNAPGERSWQVRYDLDLASYGLPGLSMMVRHIRGSGIDGSHTKESSAYFDLYGKGEKEHETDLEARYVVPDGSLRDLSVRLMHAWHSGSDSTGGSTRELRLITEYPLNIF